MKNKSKESEQFTKWRITELAPFYLGIIITELETGKQFVRNLISTDEPIPCEVTERFHTIFDNQRSIPISITQCGADLDDPSMVKIIYEGNLVLSPDLPVKSAVDVTLGCKADGSMTCSFKEVQTGNVKNIDLRIGQGDAAPIEDSIDLDEFKVE